MIPTPNPSLPPDDVADPRVLLETALSYLRGAWARRGQFLVAIFAGAIVGIALSFLYTPVFRSEARLLPYRNSSSGMGGLSGLAGLAGIRVDPGMFEPTVTADLFPEIARSLDFQVDLANSEIRVGSLGRSLTVADYLRYLADSTWRGKISTYTVGLPALVLDGRGSSLAPAAADSAGPAQPTWPFMKLIMQLRGRVVVNYDKKTSLVAISTELPDAIAAADLAQLVSQRLMAAIVAIETRKADEQLRFASEQHDVALARYERAQQAVAVFADRNRTLSSATAAVERQRLERESELTYEMYSELSRQYEQLKVKKSQDTPAFSILQQPVVSPRKQSPRRSRFAIAGAFLGVAAVTGVFLFQRGRTETLA